ncbi:hypothetical protein Hanom_Chr14g01254661 [Helianthus anomalus]
MVVSICSLSERNGVSLFNISSHGVPSNWYAARSNIVAVMLPVLSVIVARIRYLNTILVERCFAVSWFPSRVQNHCSPLLGLSAVIAIILGVVAAFICGLSNRLGVVAISSHSFTVMSWLLPVSSFRRVANSKYRSGNSIVSGIGVKVVALPMHIVAGCDKVLV